MIKILFICHGNICRSPMAEYIMKKIVKDENLDNKFHIESRATSFEEIGNDIYPPIKKVLINKGIPYNRHYASHLEKNDCDTFDYLIGMDNYNITNITKIAKDSNKNKIYKLLEFTNSNNDVSDPWYTRDFNKCYDDILIGCIALLNHIKNKI